jgi:hypothetical protein
MPHETDEKVTENNQTVLQRAVAHAMVRQAFRPRWWRRPWLWAIVKLFKLFEMKP